jgi:hypothetical protein
MVLKRHSVENRHMGRVRTKSYRFEVVNKVKQWEEIAKQAQEGPQKIILRRMPGSAKKAGQLDNSRREKAAAGATEAMAAARTARPEPTVPVPTPRRPTIPPQKRKGDDSLNSAVSKTLDSNRRDNRDMEENNMEELNKTMMAETRNESYKSIAEEMAALSNEFPEAKRRLEIVMKRVNKVLQDTIKNTKAETKAETLAEIDNRKCIDSLVLYNVQNLVYPKDSSYDKMRPEEAVMGALKKMTNHTITLLSVVTMARTEEGFPRIMKITVGDAGQKGTLFRCLALAKKEMPEMYEMFRGVAFRDCFPLMYKQEVQEMVSAGIDMKNAGEIGAFRVVARGSGCNPVLQKKYKNSTKWQEHIMQQGRGQEANEAEQERDSEDALFREMPAIFRRRAYKDQQFKKWKEMMDGISRNGNWMQVDVVWKQEVSEMREAVENFRGRDIVLKRMQELSEAYEEAYNSLAKQYADGEY